MRITSLNGPPENGSVAAEVVCLIAAVENRDPVDIDPPLYEAVDAAALGDLSADRDGASRARFTYRGYEVTVTSDRRVEIEIPTPEPDGRAASKLASPTEK